MNVIKRRIHQLRVSLEYAFFCVLDRIGFFTDKKYENLWVISERGTDARDNGFIFFKYIREKYPNINVAYIIDDKSADYKKVSALGRTIKFGSIEHYISIIKAEYLISTHIYGYTPEMNIFMQMDRRNIIPLKGKKIFLQHGIIKDKMKFDTKIDLFVSGAKKEYDFLIKEYPKYKNNIKFTGLARYDTLYNDVKKQILLMPTWRLHLQHKKDISNTTYFKEYMNFINSAKLQDFLEKNRLRLLFYPHYEMQKFINNFKINNSNIVIAKFDEYDVQTLLRESSILITDFSSVFFDFAYLKKPVIYYQFDKDEYRKNHYKEGYFDYEEDGFGKVVTTCDDLVTELEKIIKNNVNMEEQYIKKIDSFFGKIDNNNCERIYKEIININ